ncbi:hypothetical protein QEG73_18350 [Chitinophagaceae bacterium 26-R-25]|nr:hypothetical protein [Chitinophagaceae bacterium 26-R-25]
MFIFIGLGQGKDVIITFIENVKNDGNVHSFGDNLIVKTYFFIAIAFWVYVSWYSSRIISYMKKAKQLGYVQQFDESLTEDQCCEKYEVKLSYLDHFPRIIGYACFLVLILAFENLLHPVFFSKVSPFILLFITLLILWLFDSRFIKLSKEKPALIRRLFNLSGILFIFLLIVFQLPVFHNSIKTVFVLLVLGLLVYFFYINLRRNDLERTQAQQNLALQKDGLINRLLKKIMRYVNLPTIEIGYFKWFNIFAIVGFIIYLAAILSYKFAVSIGPFPLVLLAFAMLLGFGNIITMFSVKTKVNLHFIIFILAALLPTPENHFVRQVPLTQKASFVSYANRESIDQHFMSWLQHHNDIDSASVYPVYFVLANGGASRSGYWVASVLGRLEDSSIAQTPNDRFSSHVFCLSGTSGGGVGVAAFFTLLKHSNDVPPQPQFEKSAKNYLKQDFLTHTLAHMLGPDYFNYLPVINYLVRFTKAGDRAKALENGFEECTDTSYYRLRFDSTNMSQCVTQQNTYSSLPVLCVNTTRVQDGTPGVVCTIKLDNPVFNKRVDVLSLLQNDKSIRLSSAAILGARFPYVSPAGRIDELIPKQQGELDKKDSRAKSNEDKVKDSSRAHYFVDGGYFDNSGAGVVQEMITGMLRTADTVSDPVLKARIKKLKLVVLHITNSPQGDVVLKKVTPFKNDLSAPLLTILGAYDMQTTVNDRRLVSFIGSIKPGRDSISNAIYYPIHLYNDPTIDKDTLSKGPYAMNWFISDSVLNQMDKRLNTQPRLQQLIDQQKINDVHFVR